MARALDALDAALNANPSAANQQAQTPAGQPPQPGQNTPPPSPKSPAQAAMAAAAQAAAAAMRSARSEPPKDPKPGQMAQSDRQEKSDAGSQDEGAGEYLKLPGAADLKPTDWGKLPKKVAEELTQAQREAVAGEYRNQVETYYRVIAEKSKTP
jgi:hypothetical protein